MKMRTAIGVLGVILAGSAGATHAQNQSMTPLPPGASTPHLGRGLIVMSSDGTGSVELVGNPIPVSLAKEKASYLGVSISPASPELRSQIGLLPGFGLVVDTVQPGSPADAAGVKQYDVLTQFGDQQLVDAEQLAALVRSKQPDDSVDLTLIRQGKPLTLTAKIIQAEVPVASENAGALNFLPMPGLVLDNPPATPGEPRRLSVKVTPFPDAPAAPWKTGGSIRILQDWASGQFFVFATNQGSTRLTVSDRNNLSVFDGPIDTPEQRDHIPADVNKRLAELMKMNNLTWDEIISRDKSDAPAVTAPPAPGI